MVSRTQRRGRNHSRVFLHKGPNKNTSIDQPDRINHIQHSVFPTTAKAARQPYFQVTEIRVS